MRLGFSYQSDTTILSLGIRNYGFAWVPGEEESGSSYPAQHLDAEYLKQQQFAGYVEPERVELPKVEEHLPILLPKGLRGA